MRALVRYYRWCYSIYLNLSFKFHQWKFVENLLYEIVLNAITEMNNQRKKKFIIKVYLKDQCQWVYASSKLCLSLNQRKLIPKRQNTL